MYLLFPGRHHLLTDFQFKYLASLIHGGLANSPDKHGEPLNYPGPITALIVAVTSSNHSNTRRNPIPFYLRTLALQDFCRDLEIPSFIFGIDDIGASEDFASYTLKRIMHESDASLSLRPDNTYVVCSTPVADMYERLGFRILPAELVPGTSDQYRSLSPWSLVEKIAQAGKQWQTDTEILEYIHPATYRIWSRYKLGYKVQVLFQDTLIGQDGDLTESRDYNSYVRQMDDIAQLKYNDTAAFVKPGRIGDIGCAVGSWIKCATQDERLRESDFYGIEVSRHLFEICQQRKVNREFANPNVFFSQKNAVSGLVFQPESMHTIITSSLTHEIESYGKHEDLLAFIRNRFSELCSGGVWINRDVVGPDNKNEEVYLWLQDQDGQSEDWDKTIHDRQELCSYLNTLSTLGRFRRFARDFRNDYQFTLPYRLEHLEGKKYAVLSMENACEFITKKDYTDNWKSEMHERFCFWSYEEWCEAMRHAGFRISAVSSAFANPWIIENRYQNKVALFSKKENALTPMPFPVSTMILVAEKP
ncbi:MAG: transferase [Cytophagaceae bacterium]|jgi:hypothetical protein|nr:transferase [Cytophagaceae bacterium]